MVDPSLLSFSLLTPLQIGGLLPEASLRTLVLYPSVPGNWHKGLTGQILPILPRGFACQPIDSMEQSGSKTFSHGSEEKEMWVGQPSSSGIKDREHVFNHGKFLSKERLTCTGDTSDFEIGHMLVNIKKYFGFI